MHVAHRHICNLINTYTKHQVRVFPCEGRETLTSTQSYISTSLTQMMPTTLKLRREPACLKWGSLAAPWLLTESWLLPLCSPEVSWPQKELCHFLETKVSKRLPWSFTFLGGNWLGWVLGMPLTLTSQEGKLPAMHSSSRPLETD